MSACRILPLLILSHVFVLSTGTPGCARPDRPRSQETVPDTPVPQKALQLILVTSAGWEETGGDLQRWERDAAEAPWRAVGARIPVRLGRAGMGWGRGLHTVPDKAPWLKEEGDGRAPAGVFELPSAFGAGPAGLVRIPYTQATASLRCVDDRSSKFYNRLVDSSKVAVDWSSAEEMLREDGQYRLGVVVAHNGAPAVPGGGSCIFLHVWAGPEVPTSGCTAMSAADLETVAAWLSPERHPVLVALPAPVHEQLKKTWRLPEAGPFWRSGPIPAAVEGRMRAVGSWKQGCPVPLGDLVLLEMSYWGFDARPHLDGMMIVHKDVAAEVLAIFGQLFERRFPIEKMRLIDEYGAKDDPSMEDNNSSALNCRPITGAAAGFSPHSWGTAIDLNPKLNPYVKVQDGATLILPPSGRPFADRETPAAGLVTPSGDCVQAFTARGWTWGGTADWLSKRCNRDYQHFQKQTAERKPECR